MVGKNDLTSWIAMHTRNAGMALAEHPSAIAQYLSYDGGSDIVFVRKTEELATRLEDAARNIRNDLARVDLLGEHSKEQSDG